MTEDKAEFEGTIKEVLKGGKFKVGLPNGTTVEGHPSGKIRQFHIKMVPGDKVRIEVSKYDLTKGRITYRMKG
ncbi:translation initiation factor IF-1 [bacterium]|nr:translation initiation factor IF-1 [bacterium]